MKYSLRKTNYNNFRVFGANRLEGRSYYVPFYTMEEMDKTNYLTERYNSEMVTILNGEWNFKYYSSCRDLPDLLNTKSLLSKKVFVPSCWQYTGDEKPCYINQRYEFKSNPPKVPKDTPVGVYFRELTLDKVSAHEVITFLGTSACVELYINGYYVGYSEGAHNPAEFDIAGYLEVGQNEIVVLVYKWTNGTYLECQDMFRHNGIFRDVYLTHYKDKYIRDITIKPSGLSHDKYELYLSSDVVGEEYNIRYIIKDGDKELQSIAVNSGDEIRLILDDVVEWNAEKPYLYTLIVELIGSQGTIMCLRRDFGFKNIQIRGNVYYFNDASIKFRGVNHHDSTADKGFYMTVDDYIRDIEAMKANNVNAVRTSHYPPDPLFIMMCEHYGLYVVDEADIETHGVQKTTIKTLSNISKNKSWKEHYWDRVYRMYARDKNSVAIALWSLGNESGGYACQDYCYTNLKKLTKVPIHYEGVIHTKRFAYDVISEMYPTTYHLKDYVNGKLDKKYYDKPYMLCEYAHAMGVGPGDFMEYWKYIDMKDSILGAFVWEWRDHAFKSPCKNAKYEYTYGGDHGEIKHDNNFCVDGLNYPDCTPHTGCKSMANCYSPLKVYEENGRIFIRNRYYFTSSDIAEITCDYYRNGEIVKRELLATNIPPKQQVEYVPNCEIDELADNYIVFTFTDRLSGRVLCRDSVMLHEYVPSDNIDSVEKAINTGDNLRVAFDDGMLTLSLATGCITGYKKHGVQFINNKAVREDNLTGFVGELYRAPIDNYRNINRLRWSTIGLDKACYKLKAIKLLDDGSILTVHQYKTDKKIFAEFNTNYSVDMNGKLKVDVKVVGGLMNAVDVPKIGMSVEVPRSLNNIEYYGLGDSENYSDMNNHTHMAIWKAKAEDMFESYIKPQDNGNRGGVRWLKLTDNNGNGFKITAVEKELNFSILPIPMRKLLKAEHREDVKPQDMLSLNIDTFVRGVGSGICGPDTREEFRHKLGASDEVHYSFTVTPIVNKNNVL